MKDFSFKQYSLLCITLLERHNPVSVVQFLTGKNETEWVLDLFDTDDKFEPGNTCPSG